MSNLAAVQRPIASLPIAAKISIPGSPDWVGIGANATEAYAPYRVDVKGQRIAIFGATDVMGE